MSYAAITSALSDLSDAEVAAVHLGCRRCSSLPLPHQPPLELQLFRALVLLLECDLYRRRFTMERTIRTTSPLPGAMEVVLRLCAAYLAPAGLSAVSAFWHQALQPRLLTEIVTGSYAPWLVRHPQLTGDPHWTPPPYRRGLHPRFWRAGIRVAQRAHLAQIPPAYVPSECGWCPDIRFLVRTHPDARPCQDCGAPSLPTDLPAEAIGEAQG